MKMHILLLLLVSVVSLHGMENEDQKKKHLRVAFTQATLKNIKKGNKENEDRVIFTPIKPHFWSDPDGYLVGVFDGHGGSKVSELLKNNFPTYFKQATGNTVGERLKDAIATAERVVCDNKDLDDQGSTATLAYICMKTNSLYLVNIGDSRTIVCDHEGEIIAKTRDHKPDDAEERKRIFAAHDKPDDGIPLGRVNKLAVSRSIGDKTNKNLFSGKNNIVISKPDIYFVDLKNVRDIGLGTDGLWDVFENEEVVTLVNEYQYNAGDLVKKARKMGSDDDITAIGVRLDWVDKPWYSFITERPWIGGGIASLALIGGLAYYLKYLR